MKILKHGNLKPQKFTCKECGCEFVLNYREYHKVDQYGKALWIYAVCPDCDADVFDHEPWEEQYEQ